MELPQLKEAVNSGLMYELFGKYNPNPQEPAIPQELLEEAAAQTDTALWVLGRRSGGEECDRHLENDFTLSPEEAALLEALCAHFEKVAVVLNTNGLVDLSWVEPHPQVKALLFLGVPGDEGPAAMANLLTGKVNPSGKLSVTIAQKGRTTPPGRTSPGTRATRRTSSPTATTAWRPRPLPRLLTSGPSPCTGRASTWATAISIPLG